MNLKAVIFDMDGLVLDSEKQYLSAWLAAASEMAYPLDDVVLAELSGLPGDAVIQFLAELVGSDFDMQHFRSLSSRFWLADVAQNGITIKNGFFELIACLNAHNLPFCLATNSTRQASLFNLQQAGIAEIFNYVVCRDDVVQPKPAADIFLKAAAVLDQGPADCLILEDSKVGVTAAVNAGMRCLYIPSCYPADSWASENATAVVEDLHQAQAYILQVLDFRSTQLEVKHA